jgi:hypothetical protein
MFAAAISAFCGAALGVLVDRIWRRVESVPLFRLHMGYRGSREGIRAITLRIENIGLDPLPEYEVQLSHPQRGTMIAFEPTHDKSCFPQYPRQANTFECVIPGLEVNPLPVNFLRAWLYSIDLKPVDSVKFSGFTLEIVLKNSEQVWFRNEGLGNYIAKELCERMTGQKTDQPVEKIHYTSKAPFCVEMIYKYRQRRILRNLTRSAREKQRKRLN